MKKSIVVQMKEGMDARPIALIVQLANQFQSKIYLEIEEKRVNVKSIMGMMSLGLDNGEELVVIAEGSDEQLAVDNIEKFLSGQAV